MKFAIPVVYTVTGWLEIDANSLDEAKEKASTINEEGVPFYDIKDSDTSSECMLDEIEKITT